MARPLPSLLSLLIATAAAAAEPSLRLEYEDVTGRCPDAERLRARVEASLGDSPFADDAASTLRVRVEPAGEGLRAVLTLTEGGGPPAGRRVLDTPPADFPEAAVAAVFRGAALARMRRVAAHARAAMVHVEVELPPSQSYNGRPSRGGVVAQVATDPEPRTGGEAR